MGTCSEDESVDTPSEGSRWTTVLCSKFKHRKEPAQKAAIPVIGGGVRKKLCLPLFIVLGTICTECGRLQNQAFFIARFFLLAVMALSLITVNANGLCNADKRAVLVQWLRSLPSIPDIVCLQECHCISSEECQSWFRSSGFSAVVSPCSRGCIVLSCHPLLLVNSWTDTDGRFLQCEFFCNHIFRVACVYAPNRNPERDSFLTDVLSRVTRPSLPSCVGISMLFLIDVLIALAPLLMIPRGRVPPPLVTFFLLAVLLTSGTSYTPLFLALPGLGGMAFTPARLISLGVLFPGCLPFLLVTLSLVRSRITRQFFSRLRFLWLFRLVRAFGSLMFQCFRRLAMFGLFLIFGLVGTSGCLLSRLSPIGGRWANRILRGLLLTTVVAAVKKCPWSVIFWLGLPHI